MLFASHRTCFPDLDRLSQFVPQLTLPFSPTAILFSHSLLLYDIDFIHNLGPSNSGGWLKFSVLLGDFLSAPTKEICTKISELPAAARGRCLFG